jgi:hypothetical protein
MRKLVLALFLVNAVIWSIPAHALAISGGTYDGTEVGVVDIWLAETNLFNLDNSSPDTETAWVNSILNIDNITASWTVKTENVSYYNVTDVNSGIYAFHVNAGWDVPLPDYFLIKNSTGAALYHNELMYEWGVFDVANLPGFNVGNGDFTISHVSELVGNTVPEPSISALLGMGLIGMIAVGRRKNTITN